MIRIHLSIMSTCMPHLIGKKKLDGKINSLTFSIRSNNKRNVKRTQHYKLGNNEIYPEEEEL